MILNGDFINPPFMPLSAGQKAMDEKNRHRMLKPLRTPDNYPTLAAWLAENPNPRVWARRKAKELLDSNEAVQALDMSLSETTHWLSELAHRWKAMAEKQAADQLPDSIGGNSGLTPEEVVRSLNSDGDF